MLLYFSFSCICKVRGIKHNFKLKVYSPTFALKLSLFQLELTLDSYFVSVIGERSPPSNVAWVRFRLGVICGLSLLVFAWLEGVFSGFLPPQKSTLQIPIRLGQRLMWLPF